MRKFLLAAGAAAVLLPTLSVSEASAQWRRDRSRTIVVEQQPLINGGTLAAILALQLARKAAQERDTTVIRERSTQREFVPLK